MKISIDIIEEYPVYNMRVGEDEYADAIVDIPEDKVKDIEKILKDYYRIQDYLKKLHDRKWDESNK